MTATTKRPANARPPLDRQHTRKSQDKREDALNQGLKVTIEGVVYEVRLGDVTPEITRELRRATGMGFFELVSLAGSRPDVDIISAFVWVARRIQGEYLEIDDVSVTYRQILGDDFEVVHPGKPEVDDDPEA